MTDFEGVDLRGAQFREVDLSGARFEGANFTDVRFSEVWFVNVEIDGMLAGLTINGVDVTAYVTAELARIDPERALMQPTDPEGMRESWSEITARWDKTIERAQQLPEETLHASVNGEFSFVQTLRHLVFATDKWFTAPILGGEYDPIGLPNTGSLEFPWPGLDRDADPSFAEALAVRRDRARGSRSTSRTFSSQTSRRPARCSRTGPRRSKAACTRSSKRSSGTSVTRRAISTCSRPIR